MNTKLTDWTAYAEELLNAEPSLPLANRLAKEFMARDDYPTVGTIITDAVAMGSVNSAIRLIEHLFPGWGYQVGRPLTTRSPCGWYACVFRERRNDEKIWPFAGHFSHDKDGKKNNRTMRYAADPALSLVAALCRVLAEHKAGSSAIAA